MKVSSVVWLVLAGLIGFAGFTRWQNLSEEPLIMTDGQGYYAYLPAIFIYHDLQFSFVDSINETYYPPDKRAKFIVPSGTGNVNKYFVGTAAMQAPFFLAGIALSWVAGVPVDGYSWPFQLMVGLAAMVYLSLGTLFLGRLLLDLGFRPLAVWITLVLIVFGTNLFYYVVYEPSMSHAYSFCAISAFLFFVSKATDRLTVGTSIAAAFALGLTVLIRPTNAMVVLGIPVVTSGLSGTVTFLENLFANRKDLLLAVVTFTLMVSIQPLVYLIQTGSPVTWSYEGEGFKFLSPEFFNVLFSYRKGLFVYCPVLLLAVIGTISGFSKNRGRYGWLAVFGLVSVWVIASWWMWYYGGSFGHRAFIDHYPLFAIGMAAALTYGMGPLPAWVLAVFGLALVPAQLVQTYQYNAHIIPFDNMTKEKFWNLFLRTGDDLAWYYSGYEGQDSYVGLDSLVIRNNMEQPLGWGNEQQITEEVKHEGSASAVMSADDQYGITVRRPASEVNVEANMVRVSGWVRSDSRTTDVSFVCSLEDTTGASYCWKKYPLRPQFSGRNEWTWVTALFRCGLPRDSTDRFVIYPMKSDRATVWLDELEISFIHAK